MDDFTIVSLTRAVAAVSIGVVIMVARLFFVRRRNPEKRVAPLSLVAAFGAGVVAAVCVMQLVDMKRARDERRIARRTQHLKQLQALLNAEGRQFKGIGERLLHVGQSQARSGRASIWSEDPLSDDLSQHFLEYFRLREALIERLLLQDRAFAELAADVGTAVRLPDNADRYRDFAGHLLAAKCWLDPTMDLRVSRSGSFYGAKIAGAHGDASVGSTEIAARKAAADASNAFALDGDLAARCERLRTETSALVEAVEQGRKTAFEAAATTLLVGDCEFLADE